MFAVIKTGGKQYRVEPDDVIRIERIAGKAGDEVAFENVLMMSADGDTTVGAPLVDGAKVVGTLVEQARDKKIIVFKKKRRKNYRRRNGHRQDLSIVRITEFSGPGAAKAAPKKVAAKAKAAPKKTAAKAKAKEKVADKPAETAVATAVESSES
jgi:large subunit ribosomal protein L21